MNFNIIDKSVSKNNNLGLRECLQYIIDLIDKFEQLEKALDKACELNIKYRFGKDYLYIPNDVIKQREKELKENLLLECEQQ